MNYLKAVVLLAALGLYTPAYAQEVRTVAVTAYGFGVTEAEGAKNAVLNAVSMVSGERIAASRTMNQTTKQSADSSGLATEQTDTELRETINRLTRGVVKSWRIVATRPQPEGTIQVTVSAKIAVYDAGSAIKRFRLAVVPGRNATQPLSLNSNPTDALISGITESLVASRKFAILDRQDNQAAEREYNLIQSRRVPIEELVRLQSRAVADALVIVNPSIDRVGGDPQRPLRLTVEVTVLDYASGLIKGSFSSSRRVDVDFTRSSAIQFGRILGNDVLEYAFPPLVIGAEQDMLTIDAGNTRFAVGDIVSLFRFGSPLKDPATGESRGFAEIPMGEAQIVHTTPLLSVARVAGNQFSSADSINKIVARRAEEKSVDLKQLVNPGFSSNDTSHGSKSSTSSKPGGRNREDW